MEKKSKKQTSVKQKAIFSFIRIFLLCMFLTVGLTVIVTTLIQNGMKRDVNDKLTTNHDIAQIQIATQFNNIVNDALVVKGITTESLKYYDIEDSLINVELIIQSMYEDIIESTSKYASISYIGINDDYYYAGNPKTHEVSQYMIDLYQSNATDEVPLCAYISRFKYSSETKSTTFTVTIPVFDKDDVLVGYVMMEPYMKFIVDSIKEAISDSGLYYDLFAIENSNTYYVYSDLHPERASIYDAAYGYLGHEVDTMLITQSSGSYSADNGKSFFNIFSIPVSNYTGERHQYIAHGNYVIAITLSNQQYIENSSIDRTILYLLHGIMLLIGIISSAILTLSSSRRRKQAAKTTRMAQIDNLTGLLNRAYFTENFEKAIEDNPNNKYAILFMDLDGFKNINDSYGHDMGDRVLHIVANRLVMSARRDDLIARFGGDEFAMLISYNSIDQVKYVSNKIVKAIGEPMIIDENEYQIGASLGVAIYPDHARTVDELYKISDNAMYRVKYSTKNAYYISKGDDDNH